MSSGGDPWTAGRAAWSIERVGAGLGAALDVLDEYDGKGPLVEAIVRVLFVMPEPTPEAVEAFEDAADRVGVRLKRIRTPRSDAYANPPDDDPSAHGPDRDPREFR